jgi:hypothetical protein
MISYLSEGMKKHIVEPVNYDKIKSVTQGKVGKPPLFQERLTEALKKYTNNNPDTPEG